MTPAPSNSSQTMLFQIQVEFSHSQLCHIATLSEGNPLKVLVRPISSSCILRSSAALFQIFSNGNIFKVINRCYNMLLFDIVFLAEDVDGILIVNTDGMFPIIQVLQTFSWWIVIRCPACRFRLIDIHGMSRIVWVRHRLWNSLCFWSHPSVVRIPRTSLPSPGSLQASRQNSIKRSPPT